MFLMHSRKAENRQDINLLEWLMAGCDGKMYKAVKK